MIGVITTATHKRIVAEKDAEIAGLMARLDRSHSNWQRAMANEVKTALLAADRAKEIRRLEARLAVFTAPRQRGPRGRFLSTKEQVA